MAARPLLVTLVVLALAGSAHVTAAPPPPAGPSCGGPGAPCVHADEAPPGVDLHRLPSTEELLAAHPDAAEPASPLAAAALDCDDDGTSGPRVQLIYARAGDTVDRFADVLPLLRADADDADALVNVSAGQAGEGRRIRFARNARCRVDVASVTLSATGDDTFANTRAELRDQGFTADNRKYAVFVDAAVGICGVAQLYDDDRPGQDNLSNTGPAMYARVDAPCWPTALLHEVLHTLGAVQKSAPHASRAGHCTDEQDVMCYPDAIDVVMTLACPDADVGQVDCNHDDYFSPNPAPDSYLAGAWNVADSRYLDVGAVPIAGPDATLTVPASGPAGVAWPVQVATTPADELADVAWSTSRAGCSFGDPTAATPTWICPATMTGTAQVTAAVTDASGATTTVSKTVTLDETADRPPALALTASRERLTAGERATLRATVTDSVSGAPVYGMPVTTWALPAGASSWRKVATVASSRRGKTSVTVRPSANTVYAVTSPPVAAWDSAVSAGRSVGVRTRVTARLADATRPLGTAVKVTGAVRPAKDGKLVALQRRSADGWKTVASARLDGDSRYVVRWRPHRRGTITLRVVRAADARNLRGRSPARDVTVS